MLFRSGMIAQVGFSSTIISYHRNARISGVSKYNRFFGSYKVALDGIFYFSNKPIKIILFTGLVCIAIGLTAICNINEIIENKESFKNYVYIFKLLSFFSGIQLLAIGIIGEYIIRIFSEVKNRPRYIIKSEVNF